MAEPAERRASVLEDAHVERAGIGQGLELAGHTERDGARRDHRELLLSDLRGVPLDVEVAAEKSQSVFKPGRNPGSPSHPRMAARRSDWLMVPSPTTRSIPASESL